MERRKERRGERRGARRAVAQGSGARGLDGAVVGKGERRERGLDAVGK
jgi:hypothetical protein